MRQTKNLGLKAFALLLAWLFTIGTAAQEGRWIYMLSDDDGGRYYCDRTFKRLANDNIVIWIKKVRQLGGHWLNKNEYDCNNDRFRVLSYTRYDSAGKVVETSDSSNGEWQAVVPDTVGEGVFNFVCSSTRKGAEN